MGGGGSKLGDDAMNIGVELDTFEGKYVGSVPVKAPKGADVCQDAVTRILSLKQPERPIAIRITTLGVFIIDTKTGDILKDVLTPEVSFVSMDPRDAKLISFFENEEALRLITCHTFRIAKDALQLPVTINQAFKILSGEIAAPEASEAKQLKRKVSKKDALAEARAGPKIVKGDLMETYDATYIGSAACEQPKGDEVIAAATTAILGQNNKPVKGQIQLFVNAFVINDSSGNELVAAHIRDVTFAKLSQDQKSFAVIIADRRSKETNTYAFAVEPLPEGRISIRRAIDAAQKKNLALAQQQEEESKKTSETLYSDAGRRASSASALPKADGEAAPPEVATGKILGVHEANFLGSINVPQQKGIDVVEDAYEALKKLKTPVQGVFIQLGTESIKLLESLTHEILATQVFKSVSFTCAIGAKGNVFAYITVDEALGLNTCNFFLCNGKGAEDLARAFGDVFKALMEEQSKVGANPFAGVGERMVPPDDLFKIQIHRSDLQAIKVIGAGAFGQVYLADQRTADGLVRRAVKMLRGGASEVDRKAFIRETQVQMVLNHPNLVNLIGVTMQQRPWLMVLDYCQYGDLRGVLKGCEARNIVLSEAEQLNMALQVCKGMAYMANLRLIHMDLAARNCLVANGTLVKVADFGLSRNLPKGKDYWQSESVLRLPVKWCSIEALDDRLFSEASDVWAFGVTMWEISTYGAMPYEELKPQEVQRKVREGVRLVKAAKSSEDFHRICAACWALDRKARPTFKAIEEQISKALAKIGSPAVRDIGVLLTSKK